MKEIHSEEIGAYLSESHDLGVVFSMLWQIESKVYILWASVQTVSFNIFAFMIKAVAKPLGVGAC